MTYLSNNTKRNIKGSHLTEKERIYGNKKTDLDLKLRRKK